MVLYFEINNNLAAQSSAISLSLKTRCSFFINLVTLEQSKQPERRLSQDCCQARLAVFFASVKQLGATQSIRFKQQNLHSDEKRPVACNRAIFAACLAVPTVEMVC